MVCLGIAVRPCLAEAQDPPPDDDIAAMAPAAKNANSKKYRSICKKSIPIDIVFYIIFRQYLYAVPFSGSGPVGENISLLHSDRDHKSHPLPPPPLPISNHFLPFLPACPESLLPLFSLSTPKPADELRNDYWSGEGAAKERKKRTEGKAVSNPGPLVSPPSPSLFLAGGRAFSFD